MQPVKITAKKGQARPKNPHQIGFDPKYKAFESTVQWHDCPEATEDGEVEAQLIWQSFSEIEGGWVDTLAQLTYGEVEQLTENGISTQRIWRIVSQPQEKQTMENKKEIILKFDDFNNIIYRSDIGILDFYQDKDRLVYKKEEAIKIRDFLNSLNLK